MMIDNCGCFYEYDGTDGPHAPDCPVRIEWARLQAEVERLNEELENERARGIHTCHSKCQRPMCVKNREIERLTAEVAKMKAALEAAAKVFEREGDRRGAALMREAIPDSDKQTAEGRQ